MADPRLRLQQAAKVGHQGPRGSGGARRPRPVSRKQRPRGRGRTQGARGCGDRSCGRRQTRHPRPAAGRARAGVLTAVSSRYTSGYWKDSMARGGRGAAWGRGLRVWARAGRAGRGARLGRWRGPSGRRRWRAALAGAPTSGPAARRRGGEDVLEAGSNCRRDREPLPGGRAQRRLRRQEGAGGAVRAPGRAHSSLCRSAGRARAARAHGPPRRGRAAATPARRRGPPRRAPAGVAPAPAGHTVRGTRPVTPGRGHHASSLPPSPKSLAVSLAIAALAGE